MKLRILGCGTSSGVPRVGNDWGLCDRDEPKNRRRRAAVLVSYGKARILVDTGPDLREQLLEADVADAEAVIWTHDHADHCHGIDDLRQLYHARGRPVAGYARQATLDLLKHRFAYAFEGKDGYPPVVAPHLLLRHVNLAGISVRAVDQPHGEITSAGLRFDAGGAAIGLFDRFRHADRRHGLVVRGARPVGGGRAAAPAAPDPSPSCPDARMDWEIGAEAGYPDPYGQYDGLSHLAGRAPRRSRAGL